MALETGTYISDLVATNPTSGDAKSQGDDHLRLLKSTVKATFPNISGAMSLTHTQLNLLDTKSLVAAGGYQKLPSGLILQWGSATTDGSGVATFTYPIAFPTAALQAVPSQSSGIHILKTGTPGTSSVTATAYNAANSLAATAGVLVAFFVLGY